MLPDSRKSELGGVLARLAFRHKLKYFVELRPTLNIYLIKGGVVQS